MKIHLFNSYSDFEPGQEEKLRAQGLVIEDWSHLALVPAIYFARPVYAGQLEDQQDIMLSSGVAQFVETLSNHGRDSVMLHTVEFTDGEYYMAILIQH